MELQNMPEASEEKQSADIAAVNETTEIVEQVEQPAKEEVKIPDGKEEIVAMMVSLSEEPVDAVKETVARLKTAFYTLRKQELDQEKQAFLEKGNEESAFAPMVDSLEEQMKELLKAYKEKRAEQAAAAEAERNANLERKNSLLEEMRAIAADSDNISRQYNKFQQLKQAFLEVGDIPAEAEKQTWKQYQTVNENFYDLLKINKDLRDYDFKKNLEAKEDLCAVAEKINTDADIVAAFRKLQDLHKQWREIGPVAPDVREAIWQRFKDASTSINKKYQEYFESRKEREKENEVAKTALCEAIEAIDFGELKTFASWETATEKIKGLQTEWKQLGFAPGKANTTLYQRFRQCCDTFFEKKAEYFKMMKDSANENLAKKIALCERAEALKDSTDWKTATQQFVDLQKECKTVGPTSNKHSDSVWKRFLSACDYFFERKNKLSTNVRKEEAANLELKLGVITALKKLVETPDAEGAQEQMRALIKQWQSIGHVPFKEKDKIYDQYQALLKQLYRKFNVREASNRMANFESSLEQITDTDKLLRERDKIMRALEQKRNELKTYENNMSFFTAKSKAGSSMLREIESRIEKIRDEIDSIEKKINLIDSKID